MTTDERLTRIENVVAKLADKTNRLDEVMVTLAESQITLTNRMDALTQRMDALTQRMDAMAGRLEAIAQQSAEGDRRLGERIESLVVAIGEFIRNRPATG